MSRGTISLIGDSILDNFYNLENKQQDLRKDLVDLNFKVENYAVEDARLINIRGGVIPNEKYKKSRKYPYITESDDKIYPLKLLAKNSSIFNTFAPVYGSIQLEPINNNMVILSIGGHDLDDGTSKIILGANYFFNAVVSPTFITEYDSILTEIKRYTDKILLISMYLPFFGSGSSYGIFSYIAEPILNRWKSFLQEMGKKHNIPILDLSKTVNCYDRSHYGISDIHPSNVTSKCMAECISYIYDNYNGYNLYFAPNCDSSKIQSSQ